MQGLFRWGGLLLGMLPAACLHAREGDENAAAEIIELRELEVNATTPDRLPDFDADLPEFAYFDLPELPHGDLILALHVVDRYREAEIPDAERWAGILYFPWIDGRGGEHLEWLAVFRYDDRLFGIDPSADSTRQEQFHIPVPVEKCQDAERWLAFAEAFVAEISPGGYDEYLYTVATDPDEAPAEELFQEEIEPGRIAPVLASERERPAAELVRLIYQFTESPNARVAREARLGPSAEWKDRPLRFADVISPTLTRQDHFRTARELLAPRWAQRAVLHYRTRVLIFDDLQRELEVLLFAVGHRLFAYHPRYGVWKTGALAGDLAATGTLTPEQVAIPGAVTAERIELLPWPSTDPDGR